MMEKIMKFADLKVVYGKQGNTVVCFLTVIKTKCAFLQTAIFSTFSSHK